MPVVHSPTYKGSLLSVNKHFETIYPALFRHVPNPPTVRRERLELPDGDFLDLDYARHEGQAANSRVVVISHGLEGDSQRPYVKGMMRAFYASGWDVVAWNFRGCSGELNRLVRFYNSGATEDLDKVVAHVVARGYTDISLVGFSLGGNMTVKFLGEHYVERYPINSAVAFSVPLDLQGCSNEIDKWHNYLYAQRFLRSLKKKVLAKARLHPADIDVKAIKRVKTIFQFDDLFTGPLHGYSGAVDYYNKCSARHFVSAVRVPLLVVNALNDTFLSPSCFEQAPFIANDSTLLLMPRYGGHCGFADFSGDGYWSEQVAVDFCRHAHDWLAG